MSTQRNALTAPRHLSNVKPASRSQLLRGLLAAAAVAGLSAASSAGATVINFDELTAGTVVNSVYSGVTFSTNTGNGGVSVFSNCCDHTAPNSIAPAPNGSFNFTGDLIVAFASTVNNLSFYIGGDDAAGVVGFIDIFGTSGLLGTVGLVADGDGSGLTEELQNLSSFSNVASIHIRNVTDPAGLVYDTFSFDTATVPEPSSLALLGIAALGFGLSRRRQGVK